MAGLFGAVMLFRMLRQPDLVQSAASEELAFGWRPRPAPCDSRDQVPMVLGSVAARTWRAASLAASASVTV